MFDDLNSLIQCALAALVVIAWEAGHLAETYKDTYKVKWRFPRFPQPCRIFKMKVSLQSELGAAALFHRRHQQRQHVFHETPG